MPVPMGYPKLEETELDKLYSLYIQYSHQIFNADMMS